jgi:hypothetical protein
MSAAIVEPWMRPLTLRFPGIWERHFKDATAARTRLQSRVSLALAFANLLGRAP